MSRLRHVLSYRCAASVDFSESGPPCWKNENISWLSHQRTADQENLNSPITSKRMTTFWYVVKPAFFLPRYGAFLTVVAAALVEAASPRSQVKEERNA